MASDIMDFRSSEFLMAIYGQASATLMQVEARRRVSTVILIPQNNFKTSFSVTNWTDVAS